MIHISFDHLIVLLFNGYQHFITIVFKRKADFKQYSLIMQQYGIRAMKSSKHYFILIFILRLFNSVVIAYDKLRCQILQDAVSLKLTMLKITKIYLPIRIS